ncbi:MAG: hypothetical protein IKH00_09030 [Bacteroidales bacterium]|nr:hypothetical protein [Bacteroidales bacterium]
MRRILVMMVVLAISTSLSAQVIIREESQLFEPDEQIYDPYLYLTPFSDAVGYSIYGSQYRKARATRSWGINLCLVSAPLFALFAVTGLGNDSTGAALVGIAGCAGSLGAGIPLWRKGRKQLDWMLDDYVRRYAPKPRAANVSIGSTPNGLGLALRF